MNSPVEPLAAVNVAEIVSWVKGINLRDWPQQSLTQLKPSMVTDPAWFGFGSVTESIVSEILKLFPGVAYQRMLSVVMPGHAIEPHVDHQAPYWLGRVHVPLITNDKSGFIVGGARHQLDVGMAYRVDTQVEHSVENSGDEPRIHFMFDVRNP